MKLLTALALFLFLTVSFGFVPKTASAQTSPDQPSAAAATAQSGSQMMQGMEMGQGKMGGMMQGGGMMGGPGMHGGMACCPPGMMHHHHRGMAILVGILATLLSLSATGVLIALAL